LPRGEFQLKKLVAPDAIPAASSSTTAICAGQVVLGVVMWMPPTPALQPALAAAGPRAGLALLKALAAVLSGQKAILPEGQRQGDGAGGCQSSHFNFGLS
jgi:hypothetical protein